MSDDVFEDFDFNRDFFWIDEKCEDCIYKDICTTDCD